MSQYSDSKLQADENTAWQKSLNFIEDNSKALDVGCSSGNFGEVLVAEKNCVVDGIEINQEDAEQADQKLRKVYQLNVELDDLSGIKERYDVLFCGDVIEHFARPVAALEKLKKLLKPEGKLVFSIPNITHMSVRLMLLEGKIEYGKTGLLDETHLHFYNSQEVYRVLNNAGFRIDMLDYTEKDLPLEYVAEKLNDLGLEVKSQFKEVLQSLDAAAYQFVGIAKIDNSIEKQELPEQSPIDETQDFLDFYVKKVEELEQHIEDVEADRDRIKAENQRLKEQEE